ncbi:MAG: hypothetical protein ACH350_10625 [Parachlamydiaceae bacterium]
MDNIKLDTIDKSFDKFTPFTLLSTITGAGRAVYGLAELITGVVRGIIFGTGQLFTDDKAYEKKFDHACLHMFFGSANIVKGIVEAIPLVNLLVWSYNEESKPLTRNDWTVFKTARA